MMIKNFYFFTATVLDWIFRKLYGCFERIDYTKRFAGKGFAVGDQIVCIRSKLKIKYLRQTLWNTNSGGNFLTLIKG